MKVKSKGTGSLRLFPYENWSHCLCTKIVFPRNRIMDIENRPVVAKGEGGWGKLSYIEWINSKVSYCIAQGTIFNIL